MANLTLSSVNKFYGSTHIVKDFNLDVKDGEFIVLLGPSGCGKSTTLRMIAGLEDVSSGTISLGGRVINNVEAAERNLAMVFQSYALYPHMTVFENISFSLKIAGMPKAEIQKQVDRVATMLQLTELLKRKPSQLSGGQRQRVAMGRAIVRNPDLFLFDEPLSNLDSKLRTQMRAELKELHRLMGTTMVYVTHDQVEAMTLADRIVILRDGVIEQIGSPLDVFLHPANTFVAGFIGSPGMNFLEGEVEEEAGRLLIKQNDIRIPVPAAYKGALRRGSRVTAGIRPCDINQGSGQGSEQFGTLRSKVLATEMHGSEQLVKATVGDFVIQFSQPLALRSMVGDSLDCNFDVKSLHLFDCHSKQCIQPEA